MMLTREARFFADRATWRDGYRPTGYGTLDANVIVPLLILRALHTIHLPGAEIPNDWRTATGPLGGAVERNHNLGALESRFVDESEEIPHGEQARRAALPCAIGDGANGTNDPSICQVRFDVQDLAVGVKLGR